MVYGHVVRERIQVNEESLWEGTRMDRCNPRAGEALPKIRELLFAGRNGEAYALAELCRQAEITLVTEKIREHIGKIQTGLTLADWGVAETATLVLDSTSEDVRIATMLSETHVAVLPRSRIKSDIMELESELSESMKSAPRYLSFISGASRTADIERVLTIGVHGPQELHLLILDDEPA
jgi:L-lactate dehydrogenase complex protein LldG